MLDVRVLVVLRAPGAVDDLVQVRDRVGVRVGVKGPKPPFREVRVIARVR